MLVIDGRCRALVLESVPGIPASLDPLTEGVRIDRDPRGVPSCVEACRHVEVVGQG